jgi:hypothetical protein
MNIDNFEDRIKEAFGRHRPATDNDAIWENIDRILKRKRSAGPSFSFGGVWALAF